MAEIIISNAAHTIIRRSVIRDLGVWPNEWSRRVPNTTLWKVQYSDKALIDILYWRRQGETFSDTLIRMFLTVERARRHHALTSQQKHPGASRGASKRGASETNAER